MPEPSLDEPTADRILLGALQPDDAPPGYAGLAALARQVTVPGAASELAGERLIVESMLAAVGANQRRLPAVRKAMLARKAMVAKRVFTAKLATLALVGTFGLGSAAAAAAGALPGQSHVVAHPLRPIFSTVTSSEGPHPRTAVGTSSHGTDTPESTDTTVSSTEANIAPTSAGTDAEGTDEAGDSAREATEATTEATGAVDTERDNNSDDQPAASIPPTTEADETPPTTAASGTSDSGASRSGSSPGALQPPSETDGEQTPSATTATAQAEDVG